MTQSPEQEEQTITHWCYDLSQPLRSVPQGEETSEVPHVQELETLDGRKKQKHCKDTVGHKFYNREEGPRSTNTATGWGNNWRRERNALAPAESPTTISLA